MLQADKLKLKILAELKRGEATLGHLKRAAKIPHHQTLLNALEFLEAIDLIEVVEKRDNLRSKVVRLK